MGEWGTECGGSPSAGFMVGFSSIPKPRSEHSEVTAVTDARTPEAIAIAYNRLENPDFWALF
jgi:hypothetical protein